MDPHVVAPRLALFAADETFAREIRLARLGHALGGAAKDADRLEHDVAAAIKKETPSVNTMADLKKSLASIREPAVAVYLCDWRFEDDFLVDALAADLSDRKIVLSVVGTEAAFSRAWTDGSVDPFDRSRITNGSPYYPGIGRSPFGKPDPEAPWHGGDSAYPPMPYHFLEMFWQTEFQKASKSAIDLGGLLGKKPDPDRPPEPPGEPAGMDDPPSDAPEPPEDLGDEGDRGRG